MNYKNDFSNIKQKFNLYFWKSLIKNKWSKNDTISLTTALPEKSALALETSVSVVIPVKDGGDELRSLIAMLKKQQGFKFIEIIIVDSGSTDGSLAIAQQMATKTIQILPEDFSHSYARNKGAEAASGDYLLFTVQDALPPSENWLLECFCMMQANHAVAASCTEFMREDVDLYYRIMSWNHNRFMEVTDSDRILRQPKKENYFSLRKNGQISDVACLISTKLFLEYKFQQNYAEDLDLGLRLIRDGYQLILLRSVPIIHSHNRSTYYHLKRGYVDGFHMAKVSPSKKLVKIKEPEFLFWDFLYVFNVLNYIVEQTTEKLKIPSSTKQLFRIVQQNFQAAAKGSYPTTIDIIDNPYIDYQFCQFLDKVYQQYYINNQNNSSYKGVLLYSVRHFILNAAYEYMSQNYEIIDAHILEDFQACLYKTFAFQSGFHLANSYLETTLNNQEKIADIHAELTKGV